MNADVAKPLIDTLNVYMQQAAGTIAKYAPDVLNETLKLIQFNGWVHIIGYIIFTIFLLIGWFVALPKIVHYFDCDWGNTPGPFISTVIMIVATITNICLWCNSLSYLFAVYDSKLALLYKIAQSLKLL